MERRGYQAAENKKAFLSTLSVSEEEYAQYVAERKRKRLPKTVTPTFLVIKGVEGPEQKSIDADLNKLVGKPVDQKEIDQSLTEIAGLGPYQTASYAFVKQ